VTSDPAVQPPVQVLADSILDTLLHRIGKDAQAARPHDWLAATILTVRNDIVERWMASTKAAHAAGAKRVYYLSLEFLIGRLLRRARLHSTASTSRTLKRSSPMRRSAMAGLGGWRRASWRAWRALRCLPMAMASAM
jgi:starch phosphorylase